MKITFIFRSNDLFAKFIPKVVTALMDAGHEVVEKIFSQGSTEEAIASETPALMEDASVEVVFYDETCRGLYHGTSEKAWPQTIDQLFDECLFSVTEEPESSEYFEQGLKLIASNLDMEKLERVLVVSESFTDHIRFEGCIDPEVPLNVVKTVFAEQAVAFAKRPEVVLWDKHALLIIDRHVRLAQELQKLTEEELAEAADCQLVILPVATHIQWVQKRGRDMSFSTLLNDQKLIETFTEKVAQCV
jgi:hypothetical protein